MLYFDFRVRFFRRKYLKSWDSLSSQIAFIKWLLQGQLRKVLPDKAANNLNLKLIENIAKENLSLSKQGKKKFLILYPNDQFNKSRKQYPNFFFPHYKTNSSVGKSSLFVLFCFVVLLCFLLCLAHWFFFFLLLKFLI